MSLEIAYHLRGRRTAGLCKESLEEISQIVKRFDPYKMPPSIEDAELHFRCAKFGKVDISDISKKRICGCCCGAETETYPKNVKLEEMTSSGATIPMFLHLSHHLAIISAALFLFGCIGQYFIIEANCREGSNTKFTCGFNLLTILDSLQRDLNSTKLYTIISECVMAFVIILSFIGFFGFLERSHTLEHNIEKHIVSSSQYTAIIYGLQEDQQNIEYVSNYINTLMRANNKEEIQILKLTTVGKSCKADLLQFQIKEVDEELSRLSDYLNKASIPKQVDALQQKKKEAFDKKLDLQDRLKNLVENKSAADSTTAVGFVTMKWKDDLYKIEELDTSWRYLRWEIYLSCRKLRLCFMNRTMHYLSKAPEPEDVIWENLGTCGFRRKLMKSISFALAVLLIIISCAVQLAVFGMRKSLLESKKTGWVYSLLASLSGILAGVVVQISNLLIKVVLEYLSDLQKPETHSDRTLSLTWKMVLLQSLNSVLSPIFSEFSVGRITDPGVLQTALFYNELTNLFLYPILTNLKLGFILRTLKKNSTVTEIREGKCFDTNQRELNQLFDPMEMDLHQLYCDMLRSYFVACFFFTHLPLLMLISTIFLSNFYSMNKNMIRMHFKKTIAAHSMFNYRMHQLSIVSLVLMALGYIFTSSVEFPLHSTIKRLILLLSIFLVYYQSIGYQDKINKERLRRRKLIPNGPSNQQKLENFENIIEDELRLDIEQLPDLDYDEASLHFASDYDRLNPTTCRVAKLEWFERISSRTTNLNIDKT